MLTKCLVSSSHGAGTDGEKGLCSMPFMQGLAQCQSPGHSSFRLCVSIARFLTPCKANDPA